MTTSAIDHRRLCDLTRRWGGRRPKCLLAMACIALWGAAALPAHAQLDDRAAAGGPDMQVLEAGPIHEAFAEPLVDPSLQGPAGEALVPREPPAPINEAPPEVQPEGANVQWIPGYWMWSPAQADFVWVSGVWRDVPPGRRWAPGHWAEDAGGFVWTPGFWVANEAEQLVLLPQPPASLEQGPNSPVPGDNYFWVPGCWLYQANDYAWQPGYWYQGQANWVWVPSYYSYTPAGYVFVDGYWDRPLQRRGFLYASVYWRSPVYQSRGFVYRPRSVVNTALLLANLFVSPHHHHYYYGAYGSNYANWGFQPWYRYHLAGPRHYDPLFAYHRWHDGRGRNEWYANLQRQYQQHGQRHGRQGRAGARHALVVSSYHQLAIGHGGRAVRKVSRGDQERIVADVQKWRQFADQRAKLEVAGQSHGRGRHGAATVGLDGNGPPHRGGGPRGDGPQASGGSRTRAGGDARGPRIDTGRSSIVRRGPDADNAGAPPGDRGPRIRSAGPANGGSRVVGATPGSAAGRLPPRQTYRLPATGASSTSAQSTPSRGPAGSSGNHRARVVSPGRAQLYQRQRGNPPQPTVSPAATTPSVGVPRLTTGGLNNGQTRWPGAGRTQPSGRVAAPGVRRVAEPRSSTRAITPGAGRVVPGPGAPRVQSGAATRASSGYRPPARAALSPPSGARVISGANLQQLRRGRSQGSARQTAPRGQQGAGDNSARVRSGGAPAGNNGGGRGRPSWRQPRGGR